MEGLLIAPAWCQAPVRKLPVSINHPALNLVAPYMSFDGDALVFVSDNAEDYVLTPFYTFREGNADWKSPLPFPKTIQSKLNFLKGYTLGPEGRILYFTTMKAPGVGGFDLWMSERKGSNWSDPKNFGAPINTRGHEACATITPDGKTLYFMRCDKMDVNKGSGCRIFTATKKSNGLWNDPEELPELINTGNSQTPRIMADGKMLLFSSDKFPGNKGGMDLYMTKLSNGEWSKPVPVDFANTPKDDQYVSVNGQGRYLLRDTQGERKSELVEYLIPKSFRPLGIMRLDGKMDGQVAGGLVPAYISVVDLSSGERMFNGRPAPDGTFTIFLTEGAKYELSIDPEQSAFTFFSKYYDLTNDLLQLDRVTATLKKIAPGDELSLDLIRFQPYSSKLDAFSINEIKRVARLIKNNPEYKYEIQVMLSGYQEDSVKSLPDLTEMQIDSITTQVADIDTLGQLIHRDTVVAKTVYNNDRTSKQATELVNALVKEGVDSGQLAIFTNARPEAVEEKRKLDVRLRVKL